MRLNTKGVDARRGVKPMVVRLRPGIAPAQVREQPLSAPSTVERSLIRPSPHQPLRGYRVRGALASAATPQTPFCVQTLRADHALRAGLGTSCEIWSFQMSSEQQRHARNAWSAHIRFLVK